MIGIIGMIGMKKHSQLSEGFEFHCLIRNDSDDQAKKTGHDADWTISTDQSW